MVGQPLRLGPFIGGLNTASDPTAIGDAELAVCDNFELDIDGSLVSRPPITELLGHVNWTERIVMLAEAVFSGVHYLIGSNTNGVYQYTGGTWTLITSTIQAAVAVQYADFVYLVAKPGSANPGGKWSPGAGFSTVANLPKGQAAVVHKARLFVVPGMDSTTNTSRLQFSDADDLDTWDPVNFIDVAQGDGTKLIDIVVFQDNLLLFKDRSTYALAYDIRPTDAVLREVSSTIGSERQFCVANFENQVYLYHRGWVYEIINYDFHRLNTKVPFTIDATTPSAFAAEHTFVSLIEDRLICRVMNKIYVYGLKTRTWSEWESEADVLHYFGPIVTIHETMENKYYAGSCVAAFRSILELFNESDSDTFESVLDNSTVTTVDTFTRTVSNGWGTSNNSLAWANVSATASDHSVNGSVGIHSIGSINVNRTTSLPVNLLNGDWRFSCSPNFLTTGASSFFSLRARYQDENNYIRVRVEISTAGAMVMQIIKFIAGVSTTLGTVSITGTFAANDTIRVRFQLNGSLLRAKGWKSSALEPNNWMISVSDSSLMVAGGISLTSICITGVTNTLPVLFRYDDITVADPNLNLIHTITCDVLTKNFDMAISHQFKKLNWWGADVSTNNSIRGTATPITASFGVTWGQLSSHTWGSLGTWGQPLSVPSSEITDAVSGTGVARRFVKFKKALRYRQINFGVQLTTNGSTADGPARLFTMTSITSSKQVVTKSVN